MSFFDTFGGKGKLSNMLTDDLLKVKEGIGDKMADFLSLLARMSRLSCFCTCQRMEINFSYFIHCTTCYYRI